MSFTNKELLELIGEIDGIQLESVGNGVAVFMDIGGRRFELIKDYGDCISHHLTRCGINGVLSNGGTSIFNQPSGEIKADSPYSHFVGSKP